MATGSMVVSTRTTSLTTASSSLAGAMAMTCSPAQVAGEEGKADCSVATGGGTSRAKLACAVSSSFRCRSSSARSASRRARSSAWRFSSAARLSAAMRSFSARSAAMRRDSSSRRLASASCSALILAAAASADSLATTISRSLAIVSPRTSIASP
ncbi:hypothetical protein SDC9_168798 [bioreactor metagenome]|uniref:Uncharacterized protein n=1 Tax=bioreactor metagenome TaxID=1076179 RepID=A0A645G6H6_9ZZZZ